MVPYNGTNLLKFVGQTRNLAFTIVSQNIKKTNLKQKPFQLLELKKGVKKKQRKKQVVVKRASDDIEALWLENLNCENLKLFRRTSFGSFRKINLEKLLEKLKEIYPEKFGSVSLANESNEKSLSTSCSPSTEPESDAEREKAPPYLSEYIVKHIIQFPLLKSKESTFSEFAEDEAEDYGAVDSQMFPSVTGILNDTMSYTARLRLKQWKERMIAEMGVEGFSKYQEDPVPEYGDDKSPDKYTKSNRKRMIVDLLTQGSKLHSTLKTYLEVADKNLVTIDPRIEGCWKSLENLLPDISDVQFVEESIYHPVLMYRGIVDCVAAYRGTPCVIEWKRSQKRKSDLKDTHDAPLQLCAYLGALPWHKKVTIKNGLVVVAYTDGTPANVFEMTLESCEFYWMEWLRRVQSYWLKKSPTLLQNET